MPSGGKGNVLIGLPAGGFTLNNEGQTVFGVAGDTLVQAQGKRDDYFTANPQYLPQYDENNLRLIRLIYTDATVDKFQFNNRLNGAWVNTFDQEVATVDLSTHSVTELNDVTNAGAGIIPSADDNTKIAALITDGVTNKTANFTINAASESDHAGKTTVYSAAVDGVCTLGDLTSDVVWAPSKIYTIRTVVNPLTINAGAGRLFDNANSSVTIKAGESLQIQGANIGGSKVFIKKLDSIHGLAKLLLNGLLVVETDEVNFTGNVVDLNDVSGIGQLTINASPLEYTLVSNIDMLDFHDAIYANLVLEKYFFGGNTGSSSNMPPVKGTGAYTCFVDSILRTDQTGPTSVICKQRFTFVFNGSQPEVFERAGDDLTDAIVNGWAKLSPHGFTYAYPYTNNTPVDTASQDTSVNPTTLPANSDVFITVLFTINANNNQYAITIPIDNTLAQLQSDIRQLRSAEPVTGGGDVALAAWVDGTSGNYHYSLDVDGGGKTLNSVSVTVKSMS